MGRPWDVRSRRPRDVRSGRPRDGQIGPLGDVLGTWKGNVLGTSWGPIFANWVNGINAKCIFHPLGVELRNLPYVFHFTELEKLFFVFVVARSNSKIALIKTKCVVI